MEDEGADNEDIDKADVGDEDVDVGAERMADVQDDMVEQEEADDADEEMEDNDEGRELTDMRRSLPRPLIPLLEFLYSSEKYSHSSRSSGLISSLSCMDANFSVRNLKAGAWNLF